MKGALEHFPFYLSVEVTIGSGLAGRPKSAGKRYQARMGPEGPNGGDPSLPDDRVGVLTLTQVLLRRTFGFGVP